MMMMMMMMRLENRKSESGTLRCRSQLLSKSQSRELISRPMSNSSLLKMVSFDVKLISAQMENSLSARKALLTSKMTS
jgi:hypothetical protein